MTQENVRKFVYNYKVVQNYFELYDVYKEFIKIKPKTIVLLGLAHGGDSLFWSEILKEIHDETSNCNIIGIDIYDELKFNQFNKYPINWSFIKGDTRDDITKLKLIDLLKDNKIDFLSIDANHTYEAVKSDFETYCDFMNKNSIIMFHDIETEKTQTGKFWNEIKNKYKNKEFINGQGSGLLYV